MHKSQALLSGIGVGVALESEWLQILAYLLYDYSQQCCCVTKHAKIWSLKTSTNFLLSQFQWIMNQGHTWGGSSDFTHVVVVSQRLELEEQRGTGAAGTSKAPLPPSLSPCNLKIPQVASQSGTLYFRKARWPQAARLSAWQLTMSVSGIKVVVAFFFLTQPWKSLIVTSATSYWFHQSPKSIQIQAEELDFFSSLSLFGHIGNMWKFPGQGLNPHCSSDNA